MCHDDAAEDDDDDAGNGRDHAYGKNCNLRLTYGNTCYSDAEGRVHAHGHGYGDGRGDASKLFCTFYVRRREESSRIPASLL